MNTEVPKGVFPIEHDHYAQFCHCDKCYKERMARWLRESFPAGGGVLQGSITST